MAYESTRALEGELARLEGELEAARGLEEDAEGRHAEEDAPETEALLEARRTQTERLAKEREGLVGELRRRAVAEGGWTPDAAGGTGADGEPVRSLGCGRAGRLRIGPHPLLPERGYLLHDRSEGTVAWVRGVPSRPGLRSSWPSMGSRGRGNSFRTLSRPCQKRPKAAARTPSPRGGPV